MLQRRTKRSLARPPERPSGRTVRPSQTGDPRRGLGERGNRGRRSRGRRRGRRKRGRGRRRGHGPPRSPGKPCLGAGSHAKGAIGRGHGTPGTPSPGRGRPGSPRGVPTRRSGLGVARSSAQARGGTKVAAPESRDPFSTTRDSGEIKLGLRPQSHLLLYAWTRQRVRGLKDRRGALQAGERQRALQGGPRPCPRRDGRPL